MKTDTYTLNSNYAHFVLADLFQGKKVVSIRIHLNWFYIDRNLKQEFAVKVARRFRNEISRFYFGNEARRGKLAASVIHLHQEDEPHLHILVELPETKAIEDVRNFVRQFMFTPRQQWNGRKLFDCILQNNVSGNQYVEETTTIIGSLIYNQRYGLETALIF